MIKYLFFIWILTNGFTCLPNHAKEIRLEKLTDLPAVLNECSGMATLGEGWYAANNDSGNPAELYVFNLGDASDLRTVRIDKAQNVDWEELAEDETYVYIGDFGNNSGKRKNLGIYRVAKNDLLKQNEAKADRIEFNYPEQTNFDASKLTNFDCESMVCIGDSLYLFTKNHGNLQTNLYSLPKFPGKYDAKLLGGFDAKGLVTSADYRITNDGPELVLLGYTDKAMGYHPFIIYFQNFEDNVFFDSPAKRIQYNGQHQTESILFDDQKSVLVSSEGNSKRNRNIYRAKVPF